MKQVLYMLMGLPGAGKTTAAEIIEDLTGAVRLSSDDARLMLFPEPEFTQEEHDQLYEYLNQQTIVLLKAGKSVVYDANLNRKVHRREKYDLATHLGIDTVLCWVQAPREVAKERRIEAVEHHVLVPQNEDPLSMFERIADTIEAPTDDEPVVAIDGTQITPEHISEVLGLQE